MLIFTPSDAPGHHIVKEYSRGGEWVLTLCGKRFPFRHSHQLKHESWMPEGDWREHVCQECADISSTQAAQ